MKTYGFLFGYVCLIKDTHHDEVFIKRTNVVVMRNNIWLYSPSELKEMVSEYRPSKLTRMNWEEL